VAHATCNTALDLGADAIITVTASGETARMLSKYRPETPIIGCVMDEQIARQLALSWGIAPVIMPFAKSTDELIELSVSYSQKAGYVKDGDLVVITAGVPVGISGTTNMLKAHLVGNALASGVGIGKNNAMGRVCLVPNDCDIADLTDRFDSGDVLVAASTSNELLPFMKESSAIITEQGGQSSHAAIVGLTLGIPVIVGVSGAMQKLKEGTLVTVDSEHGTIREMPE
jgi:pyruvate kinase